MGDGKDGKGTKKRAKGWLRGHEDKGAPQVGVIESPTQSIHDQNTVGIVFLNTVSNL